MADLGGTWLGTYWQVGIPTRFELTLIQTGNTLTGRNLDDSYLGSAQLRTTAENLVHLHHTTINLSAPIVQAKSRHSIAHWR